MEEEKPQELPAIEVLPEVRRPHAGQAQGGPTVIYRLKLMTAEEIAAHGLEKYAKAGGDDDEQRSMEA